MDLMASMNFVLCVVIAALGIVVYSKKKDATSLYLGIASALFGLSRLTTLAGLAGALAEFLIIIRTIAYLVVVFALYKRLSP